MLWIFLSTLPLSYVAIYITDSIFEHRRRVLKIGEFSEVTEEIEED